MVPALSPDVSLPSLRPSHPQTGHHTVSTSTSKEPSAWPPGVARSCRFWSQRPLAHRPFLYPYKHFPRNLSPGEYTPAVN